MKPLDYGRVNVMIKENPKGEIVLLYEPWNDEDHTTCYCILNARDGYTVRQTSYHTLTMVNGKLNKSHPLPLEEAKVWLAKYCAYHRMRTEDFMIVERASKTLTR